MNRTLRNVAASTAALIAVGTIAACAAESNASVTTASNAEIAGLFDQWNASLATGDAATVARHYAPGAVLLPTVSNKVRTDRAQIEEYFAKDFLPKKPQGVITQSFVSVFDEDSAAHSGTYDFTITDKDGETSVVPARFTFAYEKIDGKWLIEEHHSSKLPE